MKMQVKKLELINWINQIENEELVNFLVGIKENSTNWNSPIPEKNVNEKMRAWKDSNSKENFLDSDKQNKKLENLINSGNCFLD